MSRTIRFLSAAFVTVSLPSLHADDWPQWLGPKRDSVWRETGIVERFPAGGPKVLWRIPVRGGYAGPAVADGRVYLADFHPKPDASKGGNRTPGVERVLCVSAATGDEIWTHEYDCAYTIDYPAGPRVTPTVDGNRVYSLGAEGHLFCLDAKDGSVVWSKEFKKDYGAKTAIWGHSAHPLVDGDRLICLVGGKGSTVVAFDKETGKEQWRALDASEPGYCPPTMIEAGGRRQLVIWHPEAVCGLDPKTGAVHWTVELEPQYKMSIATPRQIGNRLFVGGHVDQCLLLELDAKEPKVDVVWRGKKGMGLGPINSTPFIDGKHLYGIDRKGELRCVELDTGEHVWTSLAAIPIEKPTGCATAFLVKNENRYFLATDTGDLVIAKLSPRGFDEVGRFRMLEPTGVAFGRRVVWSHPAFANRSVYARNDKELIRVSLAKPAP